MSMVRHFFHNDGAFTHEIDLNDDSITLICMDRGNLLTYDRSAVARDNDGNIVGRFGIERIDADDYWVFTWAESGAFTKGKSTRLAEGLLDSEVEISKRYIDSLGMEDVG